MAWTLREYDREFSNFLAGWLRKLPKSKGKLFYMLTMLELHGPALSGGYVKHLRDGIYELRFSFGGQIARLLFFSKGSSLYLVKCFEKKSQKTPPQFIDQAIGRRNEILLNELVTNALLQN
jgi:phage-related protein